MYTFKNSYLGNIWRIHPSFKKSVEFQWLEFFGDKILSFVLTSYLMKNKKLTEGELSVKLSALINKYTVAKVGDNLSKHIVNSGILTVAMICDCVEAYIACVYLDGGNIFTLIQDLWQDFLNQPSQPSFKNQLQELLQSKKLSMIYEYELNENWEYFNCIVKVKDTNYMSIGKGRSKKEASSNAAYNFLQEWQTIIKNL